MQRQEERRDGSDDRESSGSQRFAPERAHGPGPRLEEERGYAFPERGTRSVDTKIGSSRKAFEIVDQTPVERNRARHRKRRQRGPVENRNGDDIIVGK